MKKLKSLKLPIFCYTPESLKNKDLGLEEAPLSEHEIKYYTFYKIDVISSFTEFSTGKVYSEIIVSDTTFSSPLSLKELEILIENTFGRDI